MNVSAETLDWIRKAEGDLAAARWLIDSDQALPDHTGFFCQQAAEKYLKAFLTLNQAERVRIFVRLKLGLPAEDT